jgi:general secretion pathway protein H
MRMISPARGFTLLELLVVIVIMMAVAAVTSVNVLSGRDSVSLKTSARQLVSTLRSVRVRAISDGVETGLRLSRANDTLYTIMHNDTAVALPTNISVVLIDAVRPGIVPDGSVMFYPDGSSSGGQLVLNSSVGSMRIDIDWLTGKVVLDQTPLL